MKLANAVIENAVPEYTAELVSRATQERRVSTLMETVSTT